MKFYNLSLVFVMFIGFLKSPFVQAQELYFDFIDNERLVSHLNSSIEEYIDVSGLRQKYQLQLDPSKSYTSSRYADAAPIVLFVGSTGLIHIGFTAIAVFDAVLETNVYSSVAEFLFNHIRFHFTLNTPDQAIPGSVLVYLGYEYKEEEEAFLNFNMTNYRANNDIRKIYPSFQFPPQISRGKYSPIYFDPSFFAETDGVITTNSIAITM